MRRYEFKLPDIGEGVTEGEIVQWLADVGETVTEDQPLVEVMTDKATVTITAPKAGKVIERFGPAGTMVPVHAVLVVFDLDSNGASGGHVAHPDEPTVISAPDKASPKKAEPAATAVGDIKETLPGMDFAAPAPPTEVRAAVHRGGSGPARGPSAPTPPVGYHNDKPLATPATRHLARELGVDLRAVPPTGPSGRVTKDDVRAFQKHPQEPAISVQAPASVGVGPATLPDSAPPSLPRVPLPAVVEDGLPLPPKAPPEEHLPLPPARSSETGRSADVTANETRKPLRGIRKRIFEGMARSKHTAAHFTFVEECDVTALKDLRARLKARADKEGIKLSFLPFFVKAVVAALKRHPSLNASFDEATQEIVEKRYYNIGIASATDAGLIVPVIRDADRKSILDIAREIQRLGDDTKSGKVKPADLGGSTFTITSLGAQGGLFATPILNFPEVAILGIHQMKQKPVVRDGQIVIGDVMLLSLSFDHRIIDGHIGAAFAYEIIGYLQDPDKLFLEMA